MTLINEIFLRIVRPSFSPSMSMIIKQGRHPLLDLANENFTPNDAVCFFFFFVIESYRTNYDEDIYSFHFFLKVATLLSVFLVTFDTIKCIDMHTI